MRATPIARAGCQTVQTCQVSENLAGLTPPTNLQRFHSPPFGV